VLTTILEDLPFACSAAFTASIGDAESGAKRSLGWLGAFFSLDVPASSTLTRELLGWRPAHPGLRDDLEQGHYFHDRAA
jgi:hypothetical protein